MKKRRPRACAAVRLLSKARIGLGGVAIASEKSENARMSATGSGSARPSSSSNAPMKFMNETNASKGGPTDGSVPNTPTARSPRQCIGPWKASPRSVCVSIGPLSGCTAHVAGAVDPAAQGSQVELDARGQAREPGIGVAEIPGELVGVTEHMAARA
jgi:hypothetical protein